MAKRVSKEVREYMKKIGERGGSRRSQRKLESGRRNVAKALVARKEAIKQRQAEPPPVPPATLP